jgi:hypothetical protein
MRLGHDELESFREKVFVNQLYLNSMEFLALPSESSSR